MTWPILIGLIAVALAVAFVLYPLVVPRRPSRGVLADELAEQRATIYRQVLELEFDYRMGKLSEADYHELTQALLARASALLAQAEQTNLSLEARLEEEIAAARAALASRQPPSLPVER